MTALQRRVQGLLDRAAAIPASTSNRVAGLFVALPTSIVLGLASWLTPAPEGVGTHQQLGMAGCTMLTFTGWPCPMCGMTTTFTHLAHFHPWEAAVTQPFGLVLFAFTVVFAVAGWADVVTGRGVVQGVLDRVLRRERLVASLLLAGMLLGWLYKSMRMHPAFFGIAG